MRKKDWLLSEAARMRAKEMEEAEKMEDGGGCDMLCTYYHRSAEHLRFLANTTPDDEECDEKGRSMP